VILKKFFSFLFILLCLQSFAQQDSVRTPPQQPQSNQSFWDNAFTGGNAGLQLGSIELINVSPLLGYKLTDQFSVGVGATYEYENVQEPPYNFVSSVYGGRIFAEYMIFDNIFLHGEYEMLNIPFIDYFSNRTTLSSVLVGGGYSQPIGEKSSYDIMILFDVTQSSYSIYPSNYPILRAGFNFGL